jgi:hypothetical protein
MRCELPPNKLSGFHACKKGQKIPKKPALFNTSGEMTASAPMFKKGSFKFPKVVINVTENSIIPGDFVTATKDAVRALPKLNYEKYKELAHYIIAEAGNLPNFGKTILWKMLYFSDFDYYELKYKSITGETYRKLPNGPAPCHINQVMTRLVEEEKITRVRGAKFFGKPLEKYVAAKSPELTHLSIEEKERVDIVIERLGSMTPSQVSECSHLDTPWRVTEDKELIDYEYVFHRSPITSVREN